jgi:flagellar biosynthesis/type III secretory pathway protein FliH
MVDPIFQQAKAALEELSADPEVRRQATDREVALLLHRAEFAKGQEQAAAKARKEGREEGREEGRADLLLNQLKCKFGDVPDAVRERLKSASSEEISLWAERILFANALDEVFESRAVSAGSDESAERSVELPATSKQSSSGAPRSSNWDYEEDRRIAELLDRFHLNCAREQGFRKGFNEAYAKAFPEDALPREALAARLARHLQEGSDYLPACFRERIERATQRELWTWIRDLRCERALNKYIERLRKGG